MNVLIVEDERSLSHEMEIYLSDDMHAVNVRSGWWSIAAIIAAIAFLLLSVRAFTEGLSYMSGRQQNIHPVEATSTYTIQTPSQPAP